MDIPAIVSDENGVFDTLHGLGTAKEFADSLNALTTKYYGCAGIAWLEKLTASSRSELIDRLRELITQFKKTYRPEDAGSQLDRVLERFALCAAAGELATEWSITGWNTGEGLRCVGECFKAYVDSRGTTGDLEAVNGIERLSVYLSTYGEHRFRSSSDSGGHITIFDGYITLAAGESVDLADFNNESIPDNDPPPSRIYWVTPEALKERALDGCNFDMTLAALHKKGVLVGVTEEIDKNGKLRTVYNPRKYAPFGYTGRHRFYLICSVADLLPNILPKLSSYNDTKRILTGSKKALTHNELGLFLGFSVYSDDFRIQNWWSWRELNPRPKFLHPRYYMLSLVFTFACQLRTDTPLTN